VTAIHAIAIIVVAAAVVLIAMAKPAARRWPGRPGGVGVYIPVTVGIVWIVVAVAVLLKF